MIALVAVLQIAQAHVPLDVGDWTITELHAGPAEEGGQWFEVRNNDETDGNNLTEQSFEDGDGDSFTLIGNAIAHEGEYVVLAAEGSSVEAAAYFPAPFDLRAEAGAITLVDHTSGPIDTVAWDETWAIDEGSALAVNPGVEASAWANDLASNWCAASGTPGAVNAWCAGSDDDDDQDGVTEQAGDCDDGDAGRAAGLAEVGCDGLDQDCDGLDTCDTAAEQDGAPKPGGSPGCGCIVAPNPWPATPFVGVAMALALSRRESRSIP